jgi:hypothetical protein
MFLYNWPDDGLYTMSKSVVVPQSVCRQEVCCVVVCVTDNTDSRYECYTDGDGP